MPVATPPRPISRLAAALAPRTPEVKWYLTRRLVLMSAEIGDLDVVDLIAAEAEHPTHGLTTQQLAAHAGLTYRQADYWTRCGYLTPLPRPAGSGAPVREYPTATLLKARTMGGLVHDLHMHPDAASALADELLEDGAATAGPFTLTKQAGA